MHVFGYKWPILKNIPKASCRLGVLPPTCCLDRMCQKSSWRVPLLTIKINCETFRSEFEASHTLRLPFGLINLGCLHTHSHPFSRCPREPVNKGAVKVFVCHDNIYMLH